MLQDVAGVAQVEALVGKGQAQSRRADGVGAHLAPGGQLPDIGVDTRIGRSGSTKGIGEVPRTATNVKDRGAPEASPA